MKKIILFLVLFSFININAQNETFYKKYKLEYSKGNNQKALEYTKLSLVNKEQSENHLNEIIGDIQSELKEYDDSAKTYEKLLESKNFAITGFFSYKIGTAYYFSQNYINAIKHLENAYKSNYINSGIANNLGWCYSEIKNFKKAIEYFQIAYRQDPNYINNVNNLGYAYYLDNNLIEAKKYIHKAKSIDPNNSFIYRNLGLIAIKENLPEIACENLNIAIRKGIIERWGKLYIEELLQYCEKNL